MKRIILVLIFTFLGNGLSAQQLTSADYQVGPIHVSSPLDSVLKAFGPPSQRTEHPLLKVVKPETAIVLKYDKLRFEFHSHRLRLMEFETDTLKTYRGISVGDSKEDVLQSYGQPMNEVWHGFPDGKNCEDILSYFERGGNSTLGVSFCVKNDRVQKIIVGWGRT